MTSKNKPKRILCVEDDADIQHIIRMSLELVGHFTVETCNSGLEALEKVTLFKPDIIILDVMMPDMDGPTTLAALRKLDTTRYTPVVFLTAKVLPKELNEYRNMGALDVIIKPFDPMTLPEQIHQIWESNQITSPDSSMQEKLQAAHHSYKLRLPEKFKQIQITWESFKTKPSDDLYKKLIMETHKLAGSAATYGFEIVAQCARRIESLLNQYSPETPDEKTIHQINEEIIVLLNSDKQQDFHSHSDK